MLAGADVQTICTLNNRISNTWRYDAPNRRPDAPNQRADAPNRCYIIERRVAYKHIDYKSAREWFAYSQAFIQELGLSL